VFQVRVPSFGNNVNEPSTCASMGTINTACSHKSVVSSYDTTDALRVTCAAENIWTENGGGERRMKKVFQREVSWLSLSTNVIVTID
jgi:hypothetical protein